MTTPLTWLADPWSVQVVLAFVALYPMVTAAVWVVTALAYWRSREGDEADFYDLDDAQLPRATVLVPAYREALVLDATLAALHVLDYPDYEVVVVDDGSPDDTAEVARRHARRDPRFRVLRKEQNEGKALAMTDALPLATGEVLVVINADDRLRPDALRPRWSRTSCDCQGWRR